MNHFKYYELLSFSDMESKVQFIRRATAVPNLLQLGVVPARHLHV